MATDLCTPVLKYSHAIGVNKDHTVPWTHLTASDMFMIIKGKSSTNMRDERLMLKIVHGNTVQASHDLALLPHLYFECY